MGGFLHRVFWQEQTIPVLRATRRARSFPRIIFALTLQFCVEDFAASRAAIRGGRVRNRWKWYSDSAFVFSVMEKCLASRLHR